MIEVRGLAKRYGATAAVDDLSFHVRPGRVTGFLGPNGAGKSSTLRMILGLTTPSAGLALVNGRPYRWLDHPLRTVGALLDATAVHPGRRARDHLAWLAASNNLNPHRVDEVLDQTGLADVARRRVGGFSLGMKQRLALAAALLGDPPILVLDEPVNGLDPEGVVWIRTLMKARAAQGSTILISSHLISETAMTADHVIVIGHGRVLADTAMSDFIASAGPGHILVRTPDPGTLTSHLRARGAQVRNEPDGALAVTGLTAEQVSSIAALHRQPLHELAGRHTTLEQAYLRLTDRSVDYRTAPTPPPTQPARPLPARRTR